MHQQSSKLLWRRRVACLDVPLGLLGSMVRINGLFHLLINGIHWGYNPLILTFDPNFLGHPSGCVFFCCLADQQQQGGRDFLNEYIQKKKHETWMGLRLFMAT